MGDISGRYFQIKKKYILRLVFFVITMASAAPATGQNTYMRACDCEYVTHDGKCAYTLFLPLPDAGKSGGGLCAGDGNNTRDIQEQNTQLRSLETVVEALHGNVSELASLTLTNAQVLIDLQSKVISLQHVVMMNASYWLDETRTGPPDVKVSGSEAETEEEKILREAVQAAKEAELETHFAEIGDELNRNQDKINQVLDNVNTVTQSVTDVRNLLGDHDNRINRAQSLVESLSDSQEDRVAEVNSLRVDVGKLRSEVDVYRQAGAICKVRGLIVDGDTKYISNDSISASSVYNANHGTSQARINAAAGDGGLAGSWCPRFRINRNGNFSSND